MKKLALLLAIAIVIGNGIAAAKSSHNTKAALAKTHVHIERMSN